MVPGAAEDAVATGVNQSRNLAACRMPRPRHQAFVREEKPHIISGERSVIACF